MYLRIFTDGASRGNPGPSSYGFTISDRAGKVLYEEGKYIGIATNNVAEYSAVLEALRYVKSSFKNNLPVEIDFFADSKLAVEQLSGNYKIKSFHLRELITQIKSLEEEIGQVSYQHVPREKNRIADKLANIALDNISSKTL